MNIGKPLDVHRVEPLQDPVPATRPPGQPRPERVAKELDATKSR